MTDRQPVRATTIRCGPGQARVLELGDGPCVVVLASPRFDAGAYLPLLAALSGRFRALAVELTAPDPERADARDALLVGVAAQALLALGVGRALVVGQDASARLAVSLATSHPGAVAGLVLAAPAPLEGVQAVEVPVLLYRRGRILEHPTLFARALSAFAGKVHLGSA
jgi:pimeloyl-ACP methyl ester carboxylesterase